MHVGSTHIMLEIWIFEIKILILYHANFSSDSLLSTICENYRNFNNNIPKVSFWFIMSGGYL